MIRFELPYVMPSLNVAMRQNRWRQRAPRIALAWQVKVAIGRQMPPAPIPYAVVTIERHSVGELDWDNLQSCHKRLIDVLQPASRRHPAGLGVIAGDDPGHISLKVIAIKAGHRKDQRTVVTILDEEAYGANDRRRREPGDTPDAPRDRRGPPAA